MLEELRGRQPIIISSHIAEDIEATCQQVIVLQKKHIIFAGEIEYLSSLATGHVWKMPEEIYRRQRNTCKQIGCIEENGNRLVKVLCAEKECAPDVSAVPLVPRLEDGYLYLLTKDDLNEKSI